MEGDVFMFKKATLGISSLAITAFVGLGMATEASAGPAAPLTSLNVVQVESELGGVETINQNSFSTTRNHGENTYILQRKRWDTVKIHLLK